MFDKFHLFSSLTSQEKDTLSFFCQKRVFMPGEVLFVEGDVANALYILEAGLLEVYNDQGVIGMIHPWEFVGEIALFLEPKIRTASVKSLEESTAIVLLDFSIQQLSEKHPEIFQKIQEVIGKRIAQNHLRNHA